MSINMEIKTKNLEPYPYPLPCAVIGNYEVFLTSHKVFGKDRWKPSALVRCLGNEQEIPTPFLITDSLSFNINFGSKNEANDEALKRVNEILKRLLIK